MCGIQYTLVSLVLLAAISACTANRFTSTIAPSLVPETELARYRCEQLGMAGDKECILKQYEQIIAERADVRAAEAGADRSETNVTVKQSQY